VSVILQTDAPFVLTAQSSGARVRFSRGDRTLSFRARAGETYLLRLAQ
jgi:hypothetical protein